STPTTSCPRASRRSLRWDPMKPAAPVTRIFMLALLIGTKARKVEFRLQTRTAPQLQCPCRVGGNTGAHRRRGARFPRDSRATRARREIDAEAPARPMQLRWGNRQPAACARPAESQAKPARRLDVRSQLP